MDDLWGPLLAIAVGALLIASARYTARVAAEGATHEDPGVRVVLERRARIHSTGRPLGWLLIAIGVVVFLVRLVT